MINPKRYCTALFILELESIKVKLLGEELRNFAQQSAKRNPKRDQGYTEKKFEIPHLAVRRLFPGQVKHHLPLVGSRSMFEQVDILPSSQRKSFVYQRYGNLGLGEG